MQNRLKSYFFLTFSSLTTIPRILQNQYTGNFNPSFDDSNLDVLSVIWAAAINNVYHEAQQCWRVMLATRYTMWTTKEIMIAESSSDGSLLPMRKFLDEKKFPWSSFTSTILPTLTINVDVCIRGTKSRSHIIDCQWQFVTRILARTK